MRPRLWLPLVAGVFALGMTPSPAEASFSSCVSSLKKQVVRSGVSKAVAKQALGKVAYDEKVIEKSTRQPEYRIPIWDYMAFLVDDQRISDGRARLKQHDKLLRQVEKRYGVDRHVLVAVWGVESDYGQIKGDFFVPHALANLVCAGKRRKKFFRSELIHALKIASRGDLPIQDLQGSWAGAFGQTQFMPSTYSRLAVDFDGNGRKDLVRSIPDALGSTANFLKKAGWQTGAAWGIEVKVPKRYRGAIGRKNKASLDTWRKRGIRRIDGKRLAGKKPAGLIRPAGKNGPALLVFKNFDAFYSYNAAESYALAIGVLADHLRGYGGLKTKWPVSDPGLNRAQRLELQRLLLAAGHYDGPIDGKFGDGTRNAIKEVQKKIGLKPNGRPSLKVLKAVGGA